MHSFARHGHNKTSQAARVTRGLILNGGWRYDLGIWLADIFLFRSQLRKLRQKTISLAHLQAGEQVLDTGCGTGTLALKVARRVGRAGSVAGIDPGEIQIASARAKAARRHVPIDFQVGVIEHLPFPDQTFDVVFSTLMMHHLPAGLKRQGLTEILRVLKPGGYLLIADFIRKQDRQGRAAHFHAGGSSMQDLTTLVAQAGFVQTETEDVHPLRFSAFPGAGILRTRKSLDTEAS